MKPTQLAQGPAICVAALTMALLLINSISDAQTVRICCYNILDGPITASDDADFRVVIGAIGTQSVLGNAQAIDILAFQEGPQDASEYDDIEDNFEAVFGGNYASSFTVPDFAGCRTGFIYNTQTVQLISATTIDAGLTHNCRRGLFRPVGGSADDNFFVYSIHLKAGTVDPADAQRREEEAILLRGNANSLGPNAQIIYCGDFNIVGSTEDAFVEFFAGTSNSAAKETLNTPFGFRDNSQWQENRAFLPFHTQNPINNLDDRFDLFFVNQGMLDKMGFEYVPGSCTVLGNNGTHNLNQSINTGTGAAGFGSQLTATSDHLPVFCDFKWGQTPPKFDQSISVDAVNTHFVRQSGPVGGTSGTNDLEVEGSSNGNFAAFGVIDFDLDGTLSVSGSVKLVDNIALTMIQDNEFFTDGGAYSVFVTTIAAASVPIDGSIQYQSGQDGLACVPASLSTGAQKVATYAGVHEISGTALPDGTPDPIALYGSPIMDSIATALESDSNLRLLLVPDQASTAATFTGFTSGFGAPSLNADITVDDGLVDVLPQTISINNGSQGTGFLGGTDESDDERIEYFAAAPQSDTTPLLISFNTTLPTTDPQQLVITIEANSNVPSLELVVEQFDFSTGAWSEIATADAQLNDTSYTFKVPSEDLADFNAGGFIITRVGWRSKTPTLLFPWRTNIDLFKWSVGE